MKKRVIFNALLFILILVLGYFLFKTIQEPIKFNAVKQKRETEIIEKLLEIRKAEEAYRGITGKFAGSFKELQDTLKYGRFMIIQVNGDPDDPNFTGQITFDTTYIPAIDSVKNMGIDLATIGDVPGTDGLQFDIKSDTASYQMTTVDVVEVGIPYEKFMGEFADPKFKKYDNMYDPKKKIKFGSLSKPILTGSWE
ncbi:MAG TPA: hypothetical protein ENJ95_03700 [Bacteroidetes bacterium]|nr:hypothetical protein [Bacteroidota bacterium]